MERKYIEISKLVENTGQIKDIPKNPRTITKEKYEKLKNSIIEDPDAGIPMMNYAYPLEVTPDEATIKKIVKETNCTVVYNNEEDNYYLALTGGGMDLSQDIALAYMIAQGFIEWDFLSSVYLTNPLSVSKKDFKKILKEAIRQFKIVKANATRDLERARETLKNLE